MARIAALLVALIFAGCSGSRAQAASDGRKTSEGWAWAKIRNDEIADFNDRCRKEWDSSKELDPHKKEGWDDPCRQISQQFLVNVLTNPKLQDQIPHHGVRLRGVNVAGGIDLTDAEIKPEVRIEISRIEGDATLDDSRWKRPVSLNGSAVTGDFSAQRIHAESAIQLNDALFEGGVDLSDAKVGGDLEMWGSSFGGEVGLTSATIDRSVTMGKASFAKKVDAEGLNVGQGLFMHLGAEFKGDVFLIGAKVGGNLELRSAKAWFVDLSSAEVGELHIGGLRWWSAHGQPWTGIAANPLTLGRRGSQVPRCDSSADSGPPKLILRNLHVGAFQDDPDAWPPCLDLEGFRYDRLGGMAGVSKAANTGRADMRARTADEWAAWLERDPVFSTQPYSQLSSVLAAAGNREAAEEIQFAGRERERGEAWKHSFWSWTWLSFLSKVAGYGIGLYTFRALWWVLGLTVVGAVVLWFRRMHAGRAYSGGSAQVCIDYCRLSISARSSRTSLTTWSQTIPRDHAISTGGKLPILQDMPSPVGCSAYSCLPRWVGLRRRDSCVSKESGSVER